MKKRIAVTWEMCGYIEIEAESTEEAMEKFMKDPDLYDLPDEQDYVDGSFQLSVNDVEMMKMMCEQ